MSDRADDELGWARPGIAKDTRRGIQSDLEAAIADRLMAGSDAGGAMSVALEASVGLALPSLDDIVQSAGLEDGVGRDSVRQIEDLLLRQAGDLAQEGSRLNALLDRGASTLAERNVLRRGMLFLRNGRYREAEEWWRLNLPSNEAIPFALLLQMLLVLTHRLAGDQAKAVTLMERLRPRLGGYL